MQKGEKKKITIARREHYGVFAVLGCNNLGGPNEVKSSGSCRKKLLTNKEIGMVKFRRVFEGQQ
jgi:hypothetical protein